MSLATLLAILSDNRFHSGQSLGLSLGVSRAAVWKSIKKLEQMGVVIDSVHGKGYRLHDAIDFLDKKKIRNGLSEKNKTLLGDIVVHFSVDSTNVVAIKDPALKPSVHLAEHQSAGKGRRGRSWASPFGKNIYLSLSWCFDEDISKLEGLSLVVGLSLCRALDELGLHGVQLKWPNDLLYENRKLGGILIEMLPQIDGTKKIIIGIGLNVLMKNENMIDQPWISLSMMHHTIPPRNVLVAAMINHILDTLLDFSTVGFRAFQQEWMDRDALANRQIILSTASMVIDGIERGIDESGALRVETVEGIKHFYGGEVSVRAI